MKLTVRVVQLFIALGVAMGVTTAVPTAAHAEPCSVCDFTDEEGLVITA